MVKRKNMRRRNTTLAIIIVLVVAIGTVALIKAFNTEQDPYRDTVSTQQEEQGDVTSGDSTSKTEPQPAAQGDTAGATASTDPKDASKDPAPAPETVRTIDIPPISLTVSYVRGIEGFEYEVLRTAAGTQYVEFRGESLIGTKCTDDKGAFATIIVSPDSTEGSALNKVITLDGTKYGLSLSASNCTKDTTKLEQYQKSFSDAFGLLKKLQ